MAEYRLERLNDENRERWDAFNSSSAEGTLFHGTAWKKLAEKTSAGRPQYFLLYDGDEIHGILPFVEHDVHVFRGLSSPGDPIRLLPILKDRADPSALRFVLGELQRLEISRKKVSFVRVSASRKEMLDAITSHTLFPLPDTGDMVLDLSATPPDAVWDSFSAKKGQRKFIRRFDENGFSITEAASEDDLKRFYTYYEGNINRIGGKVQPYARLHEVWREMPDETRVTLLSKGPVLAGGMYMIMDRPRRTLYTAYLSLNRDLPNTYHPSYYLWWEAMNWAWENHFDRVSFGAQRPDENNPRFRVKYDLGARFQPTYSGMVSLSKIFSMGYQWRQRRHASSASMLEDEER